MAKISRVVPYQGTVTVNLRAVLDASRETERAIRNLQALIDEHREFKGYVSVSTDRETICSGCGRPWEGLPAWEDRPAEPGICSGCGAPAEEQEAAMDRRSKARTE